MQYELVARRGVDVQIIELTSQLERNEIKALIASAISSLSSVEPAAGDGEAD